MFVLTDFSRVLLITPLKWLGTGFCSRRVFRMNAYASSPAVLISLQLVRFDCAHPSTLFRVTLNLLKGHRLEPVVRQAHTTLGYRRVEGKNTNGKHRAPDLPAGHAGHAGLANGCFSFFSVVLRTHPHTPLYIEKVRLVCYNMDMNLIDS